MDVLQNHAIDIGINILGYLLAAGFGMVIYSMFRRRRPEAAAVAPTAAVTISTALPEAAETPSTPTSGPRKVDRNIEFLDLRGCDSPQVAEDVARATAKPAASGRRDRAEIIRIAREMLKAGAPSEAIKRTLPVSDGELALLQSGNKR
ncbi:MAG: hypothetical protein KKA42_04975 [candidate division Zixibacteria bacterium]|nr:hypothetical protein [candidate division Zixibacteria bacterium]